MEKIPQYVFIVAWLGITLVGFLNPKSVIKVMPTQWKIVGIDPNNPSKGILIFLRIIYFIAFIFGLFIFLGLLAGKLKG